MSETTRDTPSVLPGPAPAAELIRLVADTVTSTPGVARLEPTLRGTLRRALPGRLPAASSATSASKPAESNGDQAAIEGVVVRTSAIPAPPGNEVRDASAAETEEGPGAVNASITAETVIDIAITGLSAVTVSLDVQRRVTEVLLEHQIVAPTITVNVLSVDSTAPAAP